MFLFFQIKRLVFGGFSIRLSNWVHWNHLPPRCCVRERFTFSIIYIHTHKNISVIYTILRLVTLEKKRNTQKLKKNKTKPYSIEPKYRSSKDNFDMFIGIRIKVCSEFRLPLHLRLWLVKIIEFNLVVSVVVVSKRALFQRYRDSINKKHFSIVRDCVVADEMRVS